MKIARVSLSLLIILGCSQKEKTSADPDLSFNRLSEEFLTGYLSFRPAAATYLGLHEYDRGKRDYSKAGIQAELQRLKEYDQKLVGLQDSVGKKTNYDLRILLSAIRQEIFSIENLKSHEVNPMVYASTFGLNAYIQRDYAPLPERVKTIIAIEQQAPEVFAQARKNLADSLAKPYVETAILIARGSADFMEHELVEALKGLKDDTLRSAFDAANQKAMSELRSFASWLEKDKKKKTHSHYAIGTENYKKMLLYNEMVEADPAEILKMGMDELKREQELFAEVAKVIDPNKRPIEVFEALKKEHATPDNLIPDARKTLEAIRQYVIDKKLISVPSEVRVEVRETPQFARSTSTASMDTPGPFEKATQAFYFITPTEKNWTAKQKEEWLSQFNYYTMDMTSVHEAYPGHYVQFLHINSSSASRIEKIFGSYAFVEGWAHYAEKMMIEEGFGGPDKMKAAKYHLAQLDESLLRLCRLCVSVKMHTEGMTLDEATKFFETNCYYEHKPAYQEALRGTFDPGYLSYTLGKLQILKLREDFKLQEGANFSLQKFHDQLLDNGMPPLRLIREIMLKEPGKTTL